MDPNRFALAVVGKARKDSGIYVLDARQRTIEKKYSKQPRGYAAMAGLVFSPQTYACGISIYGISDLESFGKTSFANNDFWHQWVGDPFDQADTEMLKAASPINIVDQLSAPILLTTGQRDLRVSMRQIDRVAEALSAAGRDVTYFY